MSVISGLRRGVEVDGGGWAYITIGKKVEGVSQYHTEMTFCSPNRCLVPRYLVVLTQYRVE